MKIYHETNKNEAGEAYFNVLGKLSKLTINECPLCTKTHTYEGLQELTSKGLVKSGVKLEGLYQKRILLPCTNNMDLVDILWTGKNTWDVSRPEENLTLSAYFMKLKK